MFYTFKELRSSHQDQKTASMHAGSNLLLRLRKQNEIKIMFYGGNWAKNTWTTLILLSELNARCPTDSTDTSSAFIHETCMVLQYSVV